jgi:hypothetical protein
MSADDHLSIGLLTQISDETGDPAVVLQLAKLSENEGAEEVGHVMFPPPDAHEFALKMLLAAIDVEFFAAAVMAMRAHKISEEDINKILEEIDLNRRARRAL